MGSHLYLPLGKGNDPTALFSMIDQYLSRGKRVVYALGRTRLSSSAESEEFTIRDMRDSGLIKNLDKRLKGGVLTIVNPKTMYVRRAGLTAKQLYREWSRVAGDLPTTKQRVETILIIGGSAFLVDREHSSTIIGFERAVLETTRQHNSLEVVCCYLDDSLRAFRFSELASLAAVHQNTISSRDIPTRIRELNDSDLLGAFARGIELGLGPGGWNLICRTMKLIYDLDEKDFVSRPDLFELKLRDVLGESSGRVIISINHNIMGMLSSC